MYSELTESGEGEKGGGGSNYKPPSPVTVWLSSVNERDKERGHKATEPSETGWGVWGYQGLIRRESVRESRVDGEVNKKENTKSV